MHIYLTCMFNLCFWYAINTCSLCLCLCLTEQAIDSVTICPHQLRLHSPCYQTCSAYIPYAVVHASLPAPLPLYFSCLSSSSFLLVLQFTHKLWTCHSVWGLQIWMHSLCVYVCVRAPVCVCVFEFLGLLPSEVLDKKLKSTPDFSYLHNKETAETER